MCAVSGGRHVGQHAVEELIAESRCQPSTGSRLAASLRAFSTVDRSKGRRERCGGATPRIALLLCFLLLSGASANPQSGKHPQKGAEIGRLAPVWTMTPPISAPNAGLVVMPNQRVFLQAWTVYYPSDCTDETPGSWTVNSPPRLGTVSMATITGYLADGQCPGVQFPFAAIYYTWTSTEPYAQMDQFSATWSGDEFSNSYQFVFDVATVLLTDASDLQDGIVGVRISLPDQTTGQLTLTFTGEEGTASQAFPQLASGSARLRLDFEEIDPGTYSSASAQCTAEGGTVKSPKLQIPDEWVYFGKVRYTQYNVPSESPCPAGSSAAWLVTPQCEFTQIALKPQFISQAWINGTGLSDSYGILKNAAAVGLGDQSGPCAGDYPPGAVGHGATGGNTFEVVKTVTGSCNIALTDNDSAAFPSTSLSGVKRLACGDEVNLDAGAHGTEYTRTRADTCPVCSDPSTFAGADGHVDSYSSNQTCQSGPGKLADLGFFYSSQIN